MYPIIGVSGGMTRYGAVISCGQLQASDARMVLLVLESAVGSVNDDNGCLYCGYS